jgi:glycolate oxidase iron-sulfur subunit
VFVGGRVLRYTGLAALGARGFPRDGALGNVRFALAMLAGSAAPRRTLSTRTRGRGGSAGRVEATEPTRDNTEAPAGGSRGRVGVLTGCVQAGLFGRVNAATVRTLEANGYEVVRLPRQDCCGALHAHGGDLTGARALARRNIEAFGAAEVDFVAVNAAGCGATMKEYGTLFELDPEWSDRAAEVAERVRDVSELLVSAGPRRGAPVERSVAYDHPCHLLHAQGIASQPLDVLAAVPGLEVRVVANADECCGGAGIYGMTHPELGGKIGGDKVAAVLAESSDAACTPNPGCMMQIGAGLRLEGASEEVVHPVELLDESYRRAGYYR